MTSWTYAWCRRKVNEYQSNVCSSPSDTYCQEVTCHYPAYKLLKHNKPLNWPEPDLSLMQSNTNINKPEPVHAKFNAPNNLISGSIYWWLVRLQQVIMRQDMMSCLQASLHLIIFTWISIITLVVFRYIMEDSPVKSRAENNAIGSL